MKRAPIPGCSGYAAGSDGTLWSCWAVRGLGYGVGCERYLSSRWKLLKPDVRKSDGRKRYTIKGDDGFQRRHYGSKFVLEAFVGPCPAGMEACHKDGDCTNDAADNLRWGTPVSNKADMIEHGTRQRGEQINTAKLTPPQIVDIRNRRAAGEKLKPISLDFGISETMVSYICRRRNWKHV